jgi:hypothetical protein
MNMDDGILEGRADSRIGVVPRRREISVLANLAIGWSSLAAGALTGLVLGLWSFGGPLPVPEWLGDYGSLPRRLMRLGHIAFFGLGILNILMAWQMSAARRNRYDRAALVCMNFGNLLLPPTLMAAALYEPLKYLTSFPAFAVTVALVIVAVTAVQEAMEPSP